MPSTNTRDQDRRQSTDKKRKGRFSSGIAALGMALGIALGGLWWSSTNEPRPVENLSPDPPATRLHAPRPLAGTGATRLQISAHEAPERFTEDSNPLETAARTTPIESQDSNPPAALLRGFVLAPGDLPLAGARVNVWRDQGFGQELDERLAVTTDARGAFEIGVDALGQVRVVASHASHPRWTGSLDTGESGWIRLAQPSRLLGRVLDSMGSAASGSRVQFEVIGDGAVRQERRVDETGRFDLRDLKGTALRLWITGPHGSMGPLELDVLGEVERVFELAPTRELLVRVETSTGSPIEQARVLLEDEQGVRVAGESRTGADGQTTLVAPTGPMTLVVEHREHRFETMRVGAQSRPLVVHPAPSGSIELRSKSDTRLVLWLEREEAPEESRLQLLLRPGQAMTCSPLQPGSWLARWRSLPAGAGLQGTAEDWEGARELPVPLEADQVATLELETPAGAAISGVVAGHVPSFCAIELWRARDQEPLSRSPIEATGHFRVEGLEAGAYRLVICAKGEGRWSDGRWIELRAGEVQQLRLEPIAPSLAVFARDENGGSILSATAELVESGKPFPASTHFDGTQRSTSPSRVPKAKADLQGRIQLDLISSESTEILVQAPGYVPVQITVDPNSFQVDALLRRR